MVVNFTESTVWKIIPTTISKMVELIRRNSREIIQMENTRIVYYLR